MVCATAIINTNAFPSSLEAEVTSAARRLAIFLHHVDALPHELGKSMSEFFAHLSRKWQEYSSLAKSRADLEYITFPDGLGYLASLHSILYEMKAFLDIFSRLICRVISVEPGPHGFNKATIHSQELAGGRLINWLSGRSSDVLPQRDALVALLTNASSAWITSAVGVRDTLGHYRDLPGFLHMRVPLTHTPSKLTPADILNPQMPDGQTLSTYAHQLREGLCTLVSDSLLLVPNVNTTMLAHWQSARRDLVV